MGTAAPYVSDDPSVIDDFQYPNVMTCEGRI